MIVNASLGDDVLPELAAAVGHLRVVPCPGRFRLPRPGEPRRLRQEGTAEGEGGRRQEKNRTASR